MLQLYIKQISYWLPVTQVCTKTLFCFDWLDHDQKVCTVASRDKRYDIQDFKMFCLKLTDQWRGRPLLICLQNTDFISISYLAISDSSSYQLCFVSLLLSLYFFSLSLLCQNEGINSYTYICLYVTHKGALLLKARQGLCWTGCLLSAQIYGWPLLISPHYRFHHQWKMIHTIIRHYLFSWHCSLASGGLVLINLIHRVERG